MLFGAAVIAAGVAFVGSGVVYLADRQVLLGAVFIGGGVAVVGLGVGYIGLTAVVSRIRRLVDAATKAPQIGRSPNDGGTEDHMKR